MRVYVYIYTYIHVNIYLCICVSMYIHVYYTNVYTCLRILMCTDIYTLSSRNNEFLIFLFSEIGILQKFVHHSWYITVSYAVVLSKTRNKSISPPYVWLSFVAFLCHLLQRSYIQTSCKTLLLRCVPVSLFHSCHQIFLHFINRLLYLTINS